MKLLVEQVLVIGLPFAFALWGGPSAHAQPLIMLVFGDKIATPTFVGGINGGIGLTTLGMYPDATMRTSWLFGTYLNWQLGEHWHFAPEITFKSPAGASGITGLFSHQPSIDTLVVDKEEWTALSYFTIPLLLRYTNGMFGMFAGPQVGYLTEATDNLSGKGPTGESITVETSAFGRISRWDVGVHVGVEMLTAPSLGIHSMRIALRYYRGFLDAVTNVPGTQINTGFYATLGIPIGGVTQPTESEP